jgi:hypothetical protein
VPALVLALVPSLVLALASCSFEEPDRTAKPLPTSAASPSGSATPAPYPPLPEVSPKPRAADLQMVFFGNSHTARNHLPKLIQQMVTAANPQASVLAVRQPTYLLLNERGRHQLSLRLLLQRKWDVVVLQGQNYSASGRYVYPTAGARRLVHLAARQGALPILYAEWPRRGVAEVDRIIEVYTSIVPSGQACVPPVPESFGIARTRFGNLNLWAADGNHASPEGSFLAALVLFAAITKKDPKILPTIQSSSVRPQVQAQLRSAASTTITKISAQRWCPR